MARYVHLSESTDAHTGYGVSVQWQERTIRHRDREVLYLHTDAVVDTVCCGNRVFRYATVLGYVTDWKSSRTESGQPVSVVEPITDQVVQQEVEAILKSENPEVQVDFRST